MGINLTRTAILAYRRHVGALNERLPAGKRSLRQAAWAGLQDSVPRAALLSIHARVARTKPTAWEDPSLVQVWGPRHCAYVISKRDVAVFTLGRFPDSTRGQQVAEDVAKRLHAFLGKKKMLYREAGPAMGVDPNLFRYAAPTGTVLIRWDGARPPVIWTQPPPKVDRHEARLELARRYLHICGPATARAFGKWATISPRGAVAAFEDLGKSLTPVRTPLGEAWILAKDESQFRAPARSNSPARFLPSGDAYLLTADRELLVPDENHRRALWPPATVQPGGLLIDGELAGIWRRAQAKITIETWRRLSRRVRAAVEEEAATMPLPGVTAPIEVHWAR